MIQFDQVTKVYNSTSGHTLRSATEFRTNRIASYTAIENVSFQLNEGESLGLVGSNGAGKSTLLKLLTRITRPTEGVISVKGTISSLLEVGTGFHFDLNGKENIFLAGAILGMRPSFVKKRLDDIINFSGVGDYISSPVRTYSSGMLMRLAFSIGIHLDSDFIVIDEALSVGDKEFSARCLTKINDFKKNGGSIILVSHSEQQLLDVCDKGLYLDNGRLNYFGDINQAIDKYNNFVLNKRIYENISPSRHLE